MSFRVCSPTLPGLCGPSCNVCTEKQGSSFLTDGEAWGTGRPDWHGSRCTAAYGSLPSPGVPVYHMSKTSGVGKPEGYPVEDSVMWPRPGCLLQLPSVIQRELSQRLLLTEVGRASPIVVSRDPSHSLAFSDCSLTHLLLFHYTLSIL